MRPLTRTQLDTMRCGVDHGGKPCPHDSGPLFIHGRCHMGAGNEVEYRDGVLYIRCRECKAQVVDVAVAPRLVPPKPPRRQR